MRPTLGRPCCPGESERSDLSGVEAKRPPLVSKYPENSDLFSLLVVNCLCLLFLPKSELKLKFSVACLQDRLDISGCAVVCGRTGLHWLHVHGAVCYWTLAPDPGSAQYCTRATSSGPNDTFYVLITEEFNCRSPAASCAHVHTCTVAAVARMGPRRRRVQNFRAESQAAMLAAAAESLWQAACLPD